MNRFISFILHSSYIKLLVFVIAWFSYCTLDYIHFQVCYKFIFFYIPPTRYIFILTNALHVYSKCISEAILFCYFLSISRTNVSIEFCVCGVNCILIFYLTIVLLHRWTVNLTIFYSILLGYGAIFFVRVLVTTCIFWCSWWGVCVCVISCFGKTASI